jgi:hypothetical protein
MRTLYSLLSCDDHNDDDDNDDDDDDDDDRLFGQLRVWAPSSGVSDVFS